MGHNVGDEVIQCNGRVLNSMLRSSDLAGRVGGDEFLLVLPMTNYDQAKQLIARIAEQNHLFSAISKREITINFSYGIATMADVWGSSLDELRHIADARLYEQKRSKKAA